ncbi:MAG: hypothetical protein LM567_06000 [Desulfurococcaceae archaeon]|nr:hypothetical protein [Desulfurococcaceae archaeon]
MSSIIYSHYSRVDVVREIVEYASGRWVAVEGSYGERRIFVRYYKDQPLVISSENDVLGIINRYKRLNARTLYATIHVYRSLDSRSSLDDPGNIAYTTPFFDIDGSLENYRSVLDVASLIVDFLEKNGLKESVYILWSGEGAHVRINEKAFSNEITSKYNPLIIAYSIVEYVLKEIRDKLEPIAKERGIKVENLIDIKRIFTLPLSLHRRRDVVAICFKPNSITSFEPSWVDPRSFRHDPNAWKSFKHGEGDTIALEALKKVNALKPLHSRLGLIASTPRKTTTKVTQSSGGKIGRFQVMGLLQAARYYLLHGDLDKAKSFGLNRAIFYAWAKHYGRGYIPKDPRRLYIDIVTIDKEIAGDYIDQSKKQVEVLGEGAFQSPRGYFIIGDKEQLPEDYDKNITSKIENVIPYELAWEAALKYLSRFPRQVLEDPIKFYEKIYEPIRDNFIELVVRELADEEVKEETSETREQKQPRQYVKPSQEKTYGLFKWVKKT